MKTRYIFGILAILVLAVGSASASTTYLLTNNSANAPGIEVNVTLDGNYIYVTDQSPALASATNVDIKAIAFNISDSNIKSVTDLGNSANNWNVETNLNGYQNKGDFGTWISVRKSNDNDFSKGPIKIELYNPLTELPVNNKGNVAMVHLSFGSVTIVVDGKSSTSAWVSGSGTSIPEFPSIAIPVTAILGLMLILGRRKND